VHPRPYKATTVQAKTNPLGLVDLIDRAFAADGQDEVWYGDITYIHTITGWAYLATVIDGHSRKVVGWSIAAHMRTELLTDALTMAIQQRRPAEGQVVFHSDRGTQGEFQWSSQHLYRGGGSWRQEDGRRSRQRANRRRVVVGSGRPIGRCGRRCVRPGGRSPRVRSSARFGG
jgi:hypothetical protein